MSIDSSQAVDFYSVLDVGELWTTLGADLPGRRGHLKWRARCLLVSAHAFRHRRQVLRRLRAQQEIDDMCGGGSDASSISLSGSDFSSLASSLPSWYDPSEHGWSL